ncbi:MAG: Mur ligase family protein [Methyloceanibacter sp.]
MLRLGGLPARALRVARNTTKNLARPIQKSRLIRRWRAAYERRRSRATFIAVTGSSGKSTTTALISHILSGVAPVHTHVVLNRYKSNIASLQKRPPDNGYFVGEIGSEGPGTLQPMIDVIRPSIGVVTLVALEHKSAFRTCEAVAEEKQRLVEALPASGLAILNYDDPRVAAMAERTKARTVTFGQTGGEYVVSNVRCPSPGELRLTITHHDQAFEIVSQLTGVHQSLVVAAAFSCAHQLGVAPDVIVEQIASFPALFGRCSVHRVGGGPVFIVDTAKAPYHSLHLALDMLATFSAPRKRVVIGNISDNAGSDRIYRRVYQAARSVAQQVIFIGEHSHRSKATPEDIADGRFLRFDNIRDAAEFLKESAIPDELVLLKSASNLHLERLMLNFFTAVQCWKDVCGKKECCVPVLGRGCGLYEVPFEQHKSSRNRRSSMLCL